MDGNEGKPAILSAAEQEYIKQIYLNMSAGQNLTHTRQLALLLSTRSASVTDMVKKLAKKELLFYQKSRGFCLTALGISNALQIIRRHRLWELFLTDKLGIDWKEVHLIATRMQGIDSELLINRLEIYLGHPVYDPHGEVIPDGSGNLPYTDRMEIYDLKVNQAAQISGFRDSGKAFLEYIEKLKLMIGCTIRIVSVIDYHQSLEVEINNADVFIITKETAQKIYVNINSNA